MNSSSYLDFLPRGPSVFLALLPEGLRHISAKVVFERFSQRENCLWVGGWALFVACGVEFVPNHLPTNIYLTALIGILC